MAAAVGLGMQELTLFSARGAAAYLGPGYFSAMIDAAFDAAPKIDVRAILDCGDAPGYALAALRLGQKHICIDDLPAKSRSAVSSVAKKSGATVIGRASFLCFDLYGCDDPKTTARRWLEDAAEELSNDAV